MSCGGECEFPSEADGTDDWPTQEACFDAGRWLKGLKSDIDATSGKLNAFVMMEDCYEAGGEDPDPLGLHADAAQADIEFACAAASGLDDLFTAIWGWTSTARARKTSWPRGPPAGSRRSD